MKTTLIILTSIGVILLALQAFVLKSTNRLMQRVQEKDSGRWQGIFLAITTEMKRLP